MRNTKIWTVIKAHGSHYSETDSMTKREAKMMFEKLAVDTTRNINNDHLDLLILREPEIYDD